MAFALHWWAFPQANRRVRPCCGGRSFRCPVTSLKWPRLHGAKTHEVFRFCTPSASTDWLQGREARNPFSRWSSRAIWIVLTRGGWSCNQFMEHPYRIPEARKVADSETEDFLSCMEGDWTQSLVLLWFGTFELWHLKSCFTMLQLFCQKSNVFPNRSLHFVVVRHPLQDFLLLLSFTKPFCFVRSLSCCFGLLVVAAVI